NVKEQGLYNDTHDLAYDVETMFGQVSTALPTLRRLMATPTSHPEVLILSPPARSYQQIGAERAAVILEVQPYRRLAILAKEGINAAIVSSLAGWSLEGVGAIVALSPSAEDFSSADLAALGDFLGGGGRVVASPGVGATLAGEVRAAPELVYDGLVEQRGTLYLAQKGIAVLFEDRRHEVLAGFWQEVLGLDTLQTGYRIVTGRYVFHYHLGPEPAAVAWRLPFEAAGRRYDEQARPAGWLYGSDLVTVLGRREFVLLQRIPLFRPLVRYGLERSANDDSDGDATRHQTIEDKIRAC
ncbi:MAG: hypothetical protein P8189_29215, partial [Anaerolineae bacterium]